MAQTYLAGGIKITNIYNYPQIKDNISKIKCYLCLNIAHNAVECLLCETLLCFSCKEILKISGKKCLTRKCDGKFKKPNKFIRNLFANIFLNCHLCLSNQVLPFKDYQNHVQDCFFNSELKLRENLIENIVINEKLCSNMENEIEKLFSNLRIFNKFHKNIFQSISLEKLRKCLVTSDLSPIQKNEIYNMCVDGDLKKFSKLIYEYKFPLLEEISVNEFYWTPLHYAMHYGQFELICFIFDYLDNQHLLEAVLRLKSNDGRCPFLCLLKSNSISSEEKSIIFDKLYFKYNIKTTAEIRKELESRDYRSLLKKYSS
jgi:hypothetical protein